MDQKPDIVNNIVITDETGSRIPTWARILIWVLVISVGSALVVVLGRTLVPFIVGAGMAFIFDPLAGWLARKGIRRGWAAAEQEPEILVCSYHGMPKRYLMQGDPYHCQCLKTTRLVKEYLGWDDGKLVVSFQSRFGPTEWLQPYTDKTLEALPDEPRQDRIAQHGKAR